MKYIKTYESFIFENVEESYLYLHPDNDRLYFFVSYGNKKIQKVVDFGIINENLYNMAYGDLKMKNDDYNIDTTTVSNNGDMKRIFQTLYEIILDFCKTHKEEIKIEGSTEQRKNVYNLLIKRYYDLFIEQFDIYGIKDNKREIFDIRKNYNIIYIKIKR